MNLDLSIMPECYLDTNLIETLVPPNRGYNHQKGCGTVASKMQNKFSDAFAVGLLDKDKRAIKYVEEFDSIINLEALELCKHRDRHHYLIFIKPALEQWLLNNVQEVDIALKDYDLPGDLKSLTKITKTITTKSDHQFKKLFRDLKARNAEQVIRLSRWIEYLRNHAYDTNIDELRQMN